MKTQTGLVALKTVTKQDHVQRISGGDVGIRRPLRPKACVAFSQPF